MKLISPTTLSIGAGALGLAVAWPTTRALVRTTAIDDIAGDRTKTVAETPSHEYRLARSPMSSQLAVALGGGGAVLGGTALAAFGGGSDVPALLTKLSGSPKAIIFGAIAGVGTGAIAGAIHGYTSMEGVQPHRRR